LLSYAMTILNEMKKALPNLSAAPCYIQDFAPEREKRGLDSRSARFLRTLPNRYSTTISACNSPVNSLKRTTFMRILGRA
jgi:hypothetical protein